MFMQISVLKSAVVLQVLICSCLFAVFLPPTVTAAITVADIPSLDVWLKADDLTASDDDPVTSWVNNGEGADFTQSDSNLSLIHI